MTDNKSKQNIESAISETVKRFFREHMGEQAETVTTKVVGDTIIVRFKDVLSPAERHMINDHQGGPVIKDLKGKLIEKAKPLLEVMIKNLTVAEVVDIHSSFDAETGERIEVLVLSEDIENITVRSEIV